MSSALAAMARVLLNHHGWLALQGARAVMAQEKLPGLRAKRLPMTISRKCRLNAARSALEQAAYQDRLAGRQGHVPGVGEAAEYFKWGKRSGTCAQSEAERQTGGSPFVVQLIITAQTGDSHFAHSAMLRDAPQK